MSYRDPLAAAMARLDELERELARRTAASQATEHELEELRRALEQARREVIRLRAELPGSTARARRPYLIALAMTVALIAATAVAGYHSERVGVSMSYLAVAPLGFGIGGLAGCGRGARSGLIGGAIGAVLALVGLFAFFVGIWPSL